MSGRLTTNVIDQIADMRLKNKRMLDLLEAIKAGEQITKPAVSNAVDDGWSLHLSLNALVTSVTVRDWAVVPCMDFVGAITSLEMTLNDLSDWTDEGSQGLDPQGVQRWLYMLRSLLGKLLQIYDKHLRRGAPLEYLGIMTEEDREKILRESGKNTPWLEETHGCSDE